MPHISQEQINEALDVSGSFDNCFFHTYAVHILANDLSFPEDLFQFNSILGANSHASQLQKQFPNSASLSLFSDYTKNDASTFIVEKTLILGFLLREWFATEMSKQMQMSEVLEKELIDSIEKYREFVWEHGNSDALLLADKGLFYSANAEFLDYYVARGKNELNAQEEGFEKYFSAATITIFNDPDIAEKNKDKAILKEAFSAFYQTEGRLNYCKKFAATGTKLSQFDIDNALKVINQSVTIYSEADNRSRGNEQEEEAQVIQDNAAATVPQMEIILRAGEGHYCLVKSETATPETSTILNEYKSSWAQYMQDRKDVIKEDLGDKRPLAAKKSSLLVAAICPDESLGHGLHPFDLLLERINIMKSCTVKEKTTRLKTQTVAAIDLILDGLKVKIGARTQHHSTKANSVASTLLDDLTIARNEYENVLSRVGVDIQQAKMHFTNRCSEVIKAAMPVLVRDLGWEDYLKNLLKKLANAVLFVATFGSSNAFFPLAKSVSAENLEQAHSQLSAG